MITDKSILQNYIEIDKKNANATTGLYSILRELLIPNYSLKYIFLLRKSSYFGAKRNLFYRIYSCYLTWKLSRLAVKLGVYIPKDVFGPGIYIPHLVSIVINPNSKIGANCQINANVVIGQNKGKAPVIGDNVFIGAGAVICGDVRIGDNTWIGANSVVTSSFEEGNILIAGSPAHKICVKKQSWVEVFKMYKK